MKDKRLKIIIRTGCFLGSLVWTSTPPSAQANGNESAGFQPSPSNIPKPGVQSVNQSPQKPKVSPTAPIAIPERFVLEVPTRAVPQRKPQKPPTAAIATPEKFVPEAPVRTVPQIALDANPVQGIQILTPQSGNVIDVPAVSVILQFAVGSEVQLLVNGIPVDKSAVGRTETNHKTQIVTQTWYGVELRDAQNTITAIARINGSSQQSQVMVTVRGSPKRLVVETLEAQAPADGRSTITVQGQLLDQQGNRSNRNVLVTLVTTAGSFVGIDQAPTLEGFQVEARNGQFTATLQAPLNATTATIQAKAANLEAFTQFQFATALRPSIATGFLDFRLGARGMDFYDSYRNFLLFDRDYHTQLNVNGAVFATGAIGDWLFIGALNTLHPINADCDCYNPLGRSGETIAKNLYPVYGDSSTVTRTTPSRDNVYLRMERNSRILGAPLDYFMWGDYQTEEFRSAAQEFTAFSRHLHGAKLNFTFGKVQITGLYANNVEGFQRDTIAPDGTRGYYFLSKRLLIAGSEDVYLELESIDRPGTVLQRKHLFRGADYDIDYDRGALLFKGPLLRTDIDQDGQILLRRIVTTYQYDSQNGSTGLYAARVRYHFDRNVKHEQWVGATYLRESQGVRQFELYGADSFIALGNWGRVIAEYAHSSNTSPFLGPVEGNAYRLDFSGEVAKGLHTSLYYRHADTGFSNNATVSFVPGQTRYGAELNALLGEATTLRLRYDREENRGTAPQPILTLDDLLNAGVERPPGTPIDNRLTTISAGIQQTLGKARLTVDWVYRSRNDRFNLEQNKDSSQLRSRLVMPLTSTLTLNALNETTLSRVSDSVFGDRTALGLDWAIVPGLKLAVNQHWFTGGQFAGRSATTLDLIGDYKLGENTNLTARYSVLGGFDGWSGQGAVGIKHHWVMAPGLHLDLAYEHLFGDLLGRTGAGNRVLQPVAIGQGVTGTLGAAAGDSFSVGLNYTDNPDFKARLTLDHRASSSGNVTNVAAAIAGKVSPAVTTLLDFRRTHYANQTLQGPDATTELKVGLAYRNPFDDRFNALLRYEYRQNPGVIPETILLGSGTGSTQHLLALEAIYAPNWQWELYGKAAMRFSQTYLANDFLNSSSVFLSQLRVTYHLNSRVDLLGEVRWIGQPSAGYSETGLVLEAGYYMTPNLRLSAGYTFGRVYDQDFSGTRSGGGFHVGLTLKLNDLFNGFGLQPVAPIQDRPSQISSEPVIAPPTLTLPVLASPVLTTPPVAQPATPPVARPATPAISRPEIIPSAMPPMPPMPPMPAMPAIASPAMPAIASPAMRALGSPSISRPEIMPPQIVPSQVIRRSATPVRPATTLSSR